MSMQRPSPQLPPCDQCLQRKVRCDKTLPRCYRCSDASLPCTREVIRRRPGRKKGSGNVISKLRSPSISERPQWLEGPTGSVLGIDPTDSLHTAGTSSLDDGNSINTPVGSQIAPSFENNDFLSGQVTDQQSQDSYIAQSPSTTSIRQRTRSRSIGEFQAILANMPNLSRHIDLFYAKLYPIWPIIPETEFRHSLSHPETLDLSYVCLILSICALSALHIPGSTAPAPEPRKAVAQQFINQCRQLRSTYDYIENASIITVQTSLFLSCAEVEFQRARSSWFLLRESIMLAQDLGFYEVANLSPSLSPNDVLSIQRTLYLLSLVERGLTVLRNKPFAIVKFDSPPPSRFSDEDPRILNGLQSLSRLFNLLDKLFLDTWVGANYVNGMSSSPSQSTSPSSPARLDILAAQQTLASMAFETQDFTDVQKADILITQQWLRLVFWQAAMRQGLLSSKEVEEVLRYDFPCKIARSLCKVLAEIDREAIFIHGMAIVG
ncbi:hypothetical protein L207DRAFT_518910 [Hyaloscypha variabilis F]|uniref:Zn(2)-C6 fungal-type domain-containing protein n=1 Tax=Hyaloscypha variabilis (strain UAMH 11265 / GT02V1 / F) TaxID=1149755 RepID=A0A2J6R0I2_HYAVF|nr:hypothetical protein L207DRAFT_518910 [Hyaloscypha variabilis F]